MVEWNIREAGDLRRYRVHCDVIVMIKNTYTLRDVISIWMGSETLEKGPQGNSS